MQRLLLIGIGGFVGSILRYALGTTVARWVEPSPFPAGTVAVNLLGCVVIGLLAGFAEARGGLSAELRALLFVGLLGGFTTFSAFGLETVGLLRDGRGGLAVANVLVQVGFGILAVWGGLATTRLLAR